MADVVTFKPRRRLRDRGHDPVEYRHVVAALPVVAGALVWFGAIVESRAERAAGTHIAASQAQSESFMGEVRAELVRIRSEVADLKTQSEVDGAAMVSRIDKLTDLLLTGRIRVRPMSVAAEDEP